MKKIRAYFFALLTTGALAASPSSQTLKTEAVWLKTTDGWRIAASYRLPRKGRPVVVMVHGYGAGKSEWEALRLELWKRGWGSLALDLRGDGESLSGPLGRADFRVVDAMDSWAGAQRDIEAARDFLLARKIPASRIGLMGASLGANLAAAVWARAPGLGFLALLSPGDDYRGVRLERRLKGRRLVAAAPSDPYAFQSLVGYRALADGTETLEARRGHGAQMLEDARFLEGLLAWLRAR